MATRSTISIINKDGSVEGVYCHFDGYLSRVGKLLVNNYDSEKKVRELIALGSLSYLDIKAKPNKKSIHTFDNPQKGVTVAYHRDRGEELVIYKATNYDEFMENFGEAYNYLFMDGEWHYYHESPYIPLNKLLS